MNYHTSILLARISIKNKIKTSIYLEKEALYSVLSIKNGNFYRSRKRIVELLSDIGKESLTLIFLKINFHTVLER